MREHIVASSGVISVTLLTMKTTTPIQHLTHKHAAANRKHNSNRAISVFQPENCCRIHTVSIEKGKSAAICMHLGILLLYFSHPLAVLLYTLTVLYLSLFLRETKLA